MATTESKLLTADELLRLYSKGMRGELIRGVFFETMPAGQEHGETVTAFVYRLMSFIEPRKLGRLTASDSGVRLESDPDTVREPDIAFFSAEKLAPGVRVRGYAEVVPDLVVEIVSPNDSLRDVNDKARMWLSYGVSLVWVVHLDSRMVDVHRESQAVYRLTESDILEGEDVLPGFACAVGEFFGL